jgi:hypothetical protein
MTKSLDKEKLYDLYINKKYTQRQLATEFNVSQCCIRGNLKRFDIEIRGNTKNLIGQRFGKLIVIEKIGNNKKGRSIWQCRCDCGGTTNYCSDVLLQNAASKCKECRRAKYVGEISGRFFNRIKQSANRGRKLQFNITQQYIWDLFLKQDRKCAFTDIEIFFPKQFRDVWTASLDRIDSSKGYIEGNVQWVHKDINVMKQDMSDEEFIEWCKKIVKFRG